MCKLLSALVFTSCNLFYAHAQQPASYVPFKDDSLQLDLIKRSIKDKSYKGETFNTVSYVDGNVTTYKINLTSKASWLKVFPAKPGSIIIMEYFKKDKRLEMRLKKMN